MPPKPMNIAHPRGPLTREKSLPKQNQPMLNEVRKVSNASSRSQQDKLNEQGKKVALFLQSKFRGMKSKKELNRLKNNKEEKNISLAKEKVNRLKNQHGMSLENFNGQTRRSLRPVRHAPSLTRNPRNLPTRLELLEEFKRYSRKNNKVTALSPLKQLIYDLGQQNLAKKAKSVSGKLELTEENKQRLANRKTKSVGRSYGENTQRSHSVSAKKSMSSKPSKEHIPTREEVLKLSEVANSFRRKSGPAALPTQEEISLLVASAKNSMPDNHQKNDENPYVISEKIATTFFRYKDELFRPKWRDEKKLYYEEYNKLMKENPSDLIHFLVSCHIFLVTISKLKVDHDSNVYKKWIDIEIDDSYPSVKEMGDIYIGQGAKGVIQKLREIEIEYKKNKQNEPGNGITNLRGAYDVFFHKFIEHYEFKNDYIKVTYYGSNPGGTKKEDIKRIKEKYIQEHPTDTRCELAFFLYDRWVNVTDV